MKMRLTKDFRGSHSSSGLAMISDAECRKLIDMMSEGLVRTDAEHKFIFVNQQFSKMLGYPPAELIGHSMSEFVHADDSKLLLQQITERRRGKEGRYEIRWVAKDGHSIHTLVAARPVFDDDKHFIGSVAVLTDISDYKQTVQALAEAETMYRSLAEESLVGVYIIQDGRFVYANPKLADIFGYTPDEIVQEKTVMDLVAPESRALVEENIRRRIDKEVAGIHYSFKGMRSDGTTIDVEVYGSGITFRGKPAVLGTLLDVTEEKAMEESLRESEEKFRTLAENAAVAIGVIQGRHFVYANPYLIELSGYTLEELLKTDISEFIHPDFRNVILDRARRRQMGEDLPTHYEFKMIAKNGEERWMDMSLGRIQYGGKPAIVGVAYDVTERKKAEERERELEQTKREFYRRTILAATDGKLEITEREEIEPLIGEPLAFWDIAKGEDLSRIRHAVAEIAEAQGMDPSRRFDLALCAGEACTNALKHAGGGSASLHKVRDSLVLAVSDHGPGIETLTLPEVALVRGYSTAGTLGMGYKAILSVADKVYLATDPGGTTIAIVMRIEQMEDQRPVQGCLVFEKRSGITS